MTNGQYRSSTQYVPAVITTIGSSSGACVSSAPIGSGGGGGGGPTGDYGSMAAAAAFGAAGGGGGGAGHSPAAGAAPAAPSSMTYNNSLQDLQSASYGMTIGKSTPTHG